MNDNILVHQVADSCPPELGHIRFNTDNTLSSLNHIIKLSSVMFHHMNSW